MAWEENPRICLHMQLIAILSRTGVFGFISYGALSSKDESGCVVFIISAIIALGLAFCGHFFEDIASQEENDTLEEQIVSQVDSVASTDDYENDLYSGTSS